MQFLLEYFIEMNPPINKKNSLIPQEPNRPNPQDLAAFLPWACNKLEVYENIVVENVISSELSHPLRGKAKDNPLTKSSQQYVLDTSADSEKNKNKVDTDITKIYTVTDNSGNIRQLKFQGNKKVSRQILIIIGLILPYHKLLTSIVVDKGIDNASMYEINKMSTTGNITDICLDGTAIPGGCYNTLFETRNKLINLSLVRCKIQDNVIEKISINLRYPAPASQNLQLLNLSSNLITDIGATHIAEALRTNRQLIYLNLTNNRITDDGAGAILDTLTSFYLSNDELIASRQRRLQYLKEKEHIINQMAQELKTENIDKMSKKKISVKKAKDVKESSSIFKNIYEIACARAENSMGTYSEPFSAANKYLKNDLPCCTGNNRLAYLNISYNNITYITVKKIVSVLIYQQSCSKTGLVNISLEGNNIPDNSPDLEEIDAILSFNIVNFSALLKKKSSHLKVGKGIK